MNTDTVLTEIDSRGVATVTLNRPDKHNAFDDVIIAQLRAAFDKLATRTDVRVVILASAGKSFSAGADLGWMKRMAEYDYEHNLKDAELLAAMLKALHDLPQPTIAKVQGAAFGGAVGLASCCDIAIGSQRASFSLSEVKIGLIPATISPYVIRAIGERAARRYFTTGERFNATQAHRLGLLHEVVAQDQLDSTVAAMVEALMSSAPLAVRAAKALINQVAGRPIDADVIARSCISIAQIRVSDEGQEGLTAFLSKRQPNWIIDTADKAQE
jgi:methylglutaconyl-CoA hydratase